MYFLWILWFLGYWRHLAVFFGNIAPKIDLSLYINTGQRYSKKSRQIVNYKKILNSKKSGSAENSKFDKKNSGKNLKFHKIRICKNLTTIKKNKEKISNSKKSGPEKYKFDEKIQGKISNSKKSGSAKNSKFHKKISGKKLKFHKIRICKNLTTIKKIKEKISNSKNFVKS